MIAARRVFFLKRLINYRYCLTSADDTLTPLMPEAAKDGETKRSSGNEGAFLRAHGYRSCQLNSDAGSIRGARHDR